MQVGRLFVFILRGVKSRNFTPLSIFSLFHRFFIKSRNWSNKRSTTRRSFGDEYDFCLYHIGVFDKPSHAKQKQYAAEDCPHAEEDTSM
jgi:hypothetical protein